MSSEDVPGIHPERVTDWLCANIEGASAPFEFSLITGGHSNLTYRVEDAKGAVRVLRRPPLGAVIATAHDMAREHKIISGVGRTTVPVPEALGLCEDEGVNDAPFYIMDFVDGVVLTGADNAEESYDEAQREALGVDVIEVLAALHDVDPDTVGLGDLGRKEAYLSRQLARWRTQWEKTKTRELPAMESVYEALQSDIPEQVGAAIVHGDYRLGNMLSGADARIAAVIDWELCTLGDPLADLGYLLNNWAEPNESGPVSRSGDAAVSPTSAAGFPSRERMTARYQELTGRSVSRIAYYRAFQYWRLAAIVEGVMSRYLKGVMGAEANTDAFRQQIDGLADAAVEMVRSLD
ncbi:MAG: phosphotransferase family protein [Myxococcales bacterium]|nr:phosphotransferase family protein [Myxococcales bacterium]